MAQTITKGSRDIVKDPALQACAIIGQCAGTGSPVLLRFQSARDGVEVNILQESAKVRTGARERYFNP